MQDSYDIAKVLEDLQPGYSKLYVRRSKGGSTEPQSEVIQSKSQPDIGGQPGQGQSHFEDRDRIRYADTNGIVPEQKPCSYCQSCSLPDQGAEMVSRN